MKSIQFPLCSEKSPVSLEIQTLKKGHRITVSYEGQPTFVFDFESRKNRPVDKTRFSLSNKGHVTMTLTGCRGSLVIDPRSGTVLSGKQFITAVPMKEKAES